MSDRSEAGRIGPGASRGMGPGDPPPTGEAGFSLVELVIAMLILAVGLLGMAGGTAYVINRTALSEFETQRAAAFQAAVEDVRAVPFDEVASASRTLDDFSIRWEADPAGATDARTKLVTIVVEGPGRIPGTGPMPTLAPAVADTFMYRLIRRDP